MAETPPKSQPKKTQPDKKVAEGPKAAPLPEKKVAAPSPAPRPPVASKTESPPAPPAKEVVKEAAAPPPAPEPAKEITAAEPVIKAVEAAPKVAKAAAEEVTSAIEAASKPIKEEPAKLTDPIPAAAEEGTTIMTDAIETTKKVAADAKEKFQAFFGDFNEKAKAAVEKSSKIVEEVNELTKGNVEALVESGKIAAKGAESFGQEAADYSRRSFEKATSTIKSFASVKSPTEFFQLQSEFFSSAFDSFASEASKNSEAILKLAGDVVQPISTRVAVVSEKVKTFTA
ncbi:phasin family protein [Rhizorhapis sp.]|uniref:phasin family protein n=1 Tax=Rhizorhapis sp. TaxID=1968842 RepID=UPI002B486710|nr:phasin family protein [Rhizorhapis sp.]HKR16900.1 phasin family protein [Rhizorhapis sp.]